MTAVEWLIERLMDGQVDNKMLGTAKEMEKQQIIDTFVDSRILFTTNNINNGEQYYNETFKKK